MGSAAEVVARHGAAIEPAVRFYEEPPTQGMWSRPTWTDIWLSADEWTEAFASPDPGTPHNEARDQVWDEVLTILSDKHDDERRLGRGCCAVAGAQNAALRHRAQPRRGP